MFKQYKRIGIVEARPYVLNEELDGVSISSEDMRLTNTEKIGGMIARNSVSHNDQWFIAPEYWLKNFRPIVHDFGWALQALRENKLVARKGWNGKGMFLFLNPSSYHTVNGGPLSNIFEEDTSIKYQPHIDMKTADGTIVPWLCSQSDMLAEDWEIIE